MTRVLSIGYLVPGLVTGQPDVRTFPRGLARHDLRQLADDLLDGRASGQEVLVVQPAWDIEPDLLWLQVVRAVLETEHVAAYASSLPPLAGGALCALAAALGASGVSAGELWAAMPALERQLITVARLSRVDRLARPRPPVRARLASLLPTTAFGLSSWPSPHVRRLRTEDGGVALPPRAAWKGLPLRKLVIAAPHDADLRWVEEAVLPLLGAVDVVEVDPPPLSLMHWRASRVLEAVALPVDLAALRGVVEQETSHDVCRWCGARVASARCPFCGGELIPNVPALVEA